MVDASKIQVNTNHGQARDVTDQRARLCEKVRPPPHTMNKRPHSVTVIGCLFVAAGAVGFAYHLTEFKAEGPLQYDVVWVCFVRLLAVLGGVFMLRGRNWARWLLLLWMAFHVILSAFHSLSELLMHGLLFVVIAYFLFRPQASAYFWRARAKAATS